MPIVIIADTICCLWERKSDLLKLIQKTNSSCEDVDMIRCLQKHELDFLQQLHKTRATKLSAQGSVRHQRAVVMAGFNVDIIESNVSVHTLSVRLVTDDPHLAAPSAWQERDFRYFFIIRYYFVMKRSFVRF